MGTQPIVPVAPGIAETEVAPPPQPSGDTTGVTDLANLQAYINAYHAIAVIELPGGLYYLSGPLTIPSSTHLKGVAAEFAAGSPGTTSLGTQLIAAGTSTTALLNVSNSIWSVIEDIGFEGVAGNNGIVGIHDDAGDASYLFIERCRFNNFGGDFIRLHHGPHIIRANSFRDARGAGYGINLVGGASDSFITSNDMGGGNVALSRGIYVGGADNTIIGNEIFNFEVGIYIAGQYNRIEANRCEKHSLFGIQDEGGQNRIIGNVCANNGSGGGTTAGIELHAVTGSLVVGNACEEQTVMTPSNVQLYGILLNGSIDCSVVGNLCTAVTTNGIRASGATRCTINDNIVRTTGSQGIVLTASVDCVVDGNNVQGYVNQAIIVQSTSLRNKVSNNLIRGAGLQAIRINAAADIDNIVENNDLSGTTGVVDNGVGTTKRGNRVKTGAATGRAVLVNGTVTVLTAEVLAGDSIALNRVVGTGTAYGVLGVGAIVAATSFVINAYTLAALVETNDQSTIFWEIVH